MTDTQAQKQTYLVDGGDIMTWTDDEGEYALVIHHTAGLTIALTQDEMVALGRIIRKALDEERPANRDGIALGVQSNGEGRTLFPEAYYHLECTIDRAIAEQATIRNVLLEDIPSLTYCPKCGGDIHFAPLLDE